MLNSSRFQHKTTSSPQRQLNHHCLEIQVIESQTQCADSLDTVELVMALEEEFECEIPDEEAEKITSVQQAIDYVQANVS